VSQSPDKTFIVEALNYAPENRYIQSARLNGKELDGPWISHDQIVEGGTLELEMGQFPNLDWGK
jgi:putative alpha-1,2-mannosidase